MTLKNKINLSLAIFIILSLSLILFLIYPFLQGIKNDSKELISQKQKIISLETKIESLMQFQTLWQGIESDFQETEKLFIDPEVPVEFISSLEKISKDCQMAIKISSTPSNGTEKDPWPSLFFQISSATSFPKFLKFLEKIETSPYLVEISSLNVRKLTEAELKSKEFEGNSLGDVAAALSLKVYTKEAKRTSFSSSPSRIATKGGEEIYLFKSLP